MFVYENRPTDLTVVLRDFLRCEPHLHKEIEMVYMLDGEAIAYADSKRYELKKGDLFFCSANKVHYYEDFLLREAILLIFSPDIVPDFKQLLVSKTSRDAVALRGELPEGIETLFRQIVTFYKADEPFKKEICRGYMSAMLGQVLPCFSFDENNTANNDMLPTMLDYCLNHYRDPITLDTMAADLHVSKYYISRLFGTKIRIGFNEYVNMLRINDAKQRLVKTDDSITQIGSDVGYNTIRSFNRAFLAHAGCQPREYRQTTRRLIQQQ